MLAAPSATIRESGAQTLFEKGGKTMLPASPDTTITVTNANDSGAGSLRQAITDATPGSTINFHATVFATPQTITLTSGQLVIDKNVTIQGPGAALLSISGNNASRVFYINSGDVTATLDGIKIRDGNTQGQTGGGIVNMGTLIISNSAVSGNTTSGDGGGVLNAGTLTVSNSAISGNTAGGYGGGICGGLLTVSNTAISDNSASFGGGIVGSGTLTNSVVSGNSAWSVGGIYAFNLTINNSIVSGNATNLWGGGIGNFGVLNVNNSIISGNSADQGAGIVNAAGGVLYVNNSTISDNSAGGGVGGGISTSGALECLGYDDEGGCIELVYVAAVARVSNSTISSNTGGIYCSSDPSDTETLINTIVAGNTGGRDINGTIETASHNLIGDASSSGGIQNGVNGNIVGVNPLLGPLQNNGGPTMTHALLPGSPAINSGDNCVLTASGCGDGNLALPTDQRGMARNGIVDIGAFELQAATEVSVSGRVMTPDGRGLRNATVSITDSLGVRRTVTTSSFGFYQFDNVAVGPGYMMAVSSKLYRFAALSLNVSGELTNVDFVGQE